MKLVFASNNPNKLKEIRQVLGDKFEIISLKDIGCEEDIAETADTLEGNASIKSHFVYEKYGYDCFADDTGLEITALNGAPGVYSARYAGTNVSYQDNVKKALSEMENKSNRHAMFRTVISLLTGGKEVLFEGKVEGEITTEQLGKKDFGYDPIFRPTGYTETFAQMSADLKNSISHRGLALQKLETHLKALR